MENDEPPKRFPIPEEVKNDPYSWYNRDKTYRSFVILAGAIIVATFIACALWASPEEKHRVRNLGPINDRQPTVAPDIVDAAMPAEDGEVEALQ